jgi:putative endonuclease
MWSVYVLFSEGFKRYYVGMTQNFEDRLRTHNAKKVRATKAFAPWKKVFVEEGFLTAEQARKREKYLKSAAGKKFIRKVGGSLPD